MTLNDVRKTPIDELVQQMDLTDIKIHADEDGNLHSIELKYSIKAPKVPEPETRKEFRF